MLQFLGKIENEVCALIEKVKELKFSKEQKQKIKDLKKLQKILTKFYEDEMYINDSFQIDLVEFSIDSNTAKVELMHSLEPILGEIQERLNRF